MISIIAHVLMLWFGNVLVRQSLLKHVDHILVRIQF